MALTTATITYNVNDLLGADLVPDSATLGVRTNIPDDTVIDTDGNEIRVGPTGGKLSSGAGSVVVWKPGTGSNPVTWQTYLEFTFYTFMTGPGGNYVRQRRTRTFGPFTITADADLADLVQQQEVPPTYLSIVTEQLQGFVDEGQAILDAAEALTGIDDSDSAMRYNAEHGTLYAPYVTGLVNTAATVKYADLASKVTTANYHGSDANYARPSVSGPVLWIGSVYPNNVASGDLIAYTTLAPVEPNLTWLGKFDPTSLAVSDGTAIASWTNAGTGPAFVQADSSRKPIKATIGGKAAITFDGVDDRLEIAAWGGSIGPATYIMVYRPTTVPTSTATDYLFDTFNNTSTNRHRAWLLGSDGVHVGAPLGNSVLTASMPSVNNWHILSWVANGSLSICRHDGVAFSFNTGSAGSDSMSIGGPANANVNQGLIGAIGDVRVMGSALSLSSVQSVEQALAYKYGITLP